ncbi:MAG: flavin reductase family protein [Pseudomonadota bacterium]
MPHSSASLAHSARAPGDLADAPFSAPSGKPYRSALGRFATGVTVITALGPDGPFGFTANSFTSVSLEPALVLFCQKHSAGSYDGFARADALAINILSAGQQDLAMVFAGRSDDKFAGVGWTQSCAGGPPLLRDASAQLECTPHQRVAAGDHDVIICQVTGFRDGGLPPLGYCGGAFFTPAAARA